MNIEEIIYENNSLKQKYAKESGYEYEIWVYDNKGVKIDCFN